MGSHYYVQIVSVINFEPQREEKCLLICAPDDDSNQPVHPRSLIRILDDRIMKFCILGYTKCAQ